MQFSSPKPSFEKTLTDNNIVLPNVPVPIANFLPYRRAGNMIYLAGQVCEWNGTVTSEGKVGAEVDIDKAYSAARICGLNLIAALRLACNDDLDKVSHCVRVGGFVNCDPHFDSVPKVIDGASDLFYELFGERGHHARAAVGVASLPRCASVEVDAIFMLEDEYV